MKLDVIHGVYSVRESTMWVFIIVFFVCLLAVGLYFRRQRLLLAVTLLSHVLKKPQTVHFTEGPGFAIITYTRRGRSYNVYLPYHRRRAAHDGNFKVYLLREDKRVDITQQPGIPYFVTAEELGGTGYELYDQTSGDLLASRGPQEPIILRA